MGKLASLGYCPLIFPEGRRTLDGRLHSFQPGIGLMAILLDLPVVPVHIGGLFDLFSVHDRWPRSGSARIQFGETLFFQDDRDPKDVAQEIETAVGGRK
jgi:1-acyl-sn-glycerol-3-phosphate acyltransferase